VYRIDSASACDDLAVHGRLHRRSQADSPTLLSALDAFVEHGRTM
jgi:hypothetical protein